MLSVLSYLTKQKNNNVSADDKNKQKPATSQTTNHGDFLNDCPDGPEQISPPPPKAPHTDASNAAANASEPGRSAASPGRLRETESSRGGDMEIWRFSPAQIVLLGMKK